MARMGQQKSKESLSCERGKFDFVFFADLLAMPVRYGAGIDEALRRGTQAVASLDPAYVDPSQITTSTNRPWCRQTTR
jgi:hypothetical protein